MNVYSKAIIAVFLLSVSIGSDIEAAVIAPNDPPVHSNAPDVKVYLAAGVTDKDEEATIGDSDESSGISDADEAATVGDPSEKSSC